MTGQTLVLVLFLLALVLIGCTSARFAILGTWQGEGEGTVQFLADGTLIVRTSYYRGIGTYQFIDDASVRTDVPTFSHGIQTGTLTNIWEVSISDDNLTLSSPGELFKYTRVK
jgi:hypothetical protein